MADELPFVGAQHAGVIDDDGVDFPDALEGVEEDDEKDHGYAESDFGPDAESEPEQEDGREDDAGERIGDADVGVKQGGEELVAGEDEAEEDAGGDADDEGEGGFEERGAQVAPDGAGGEHLPDAEGDVTRPAEEELVHQLGADTGLPGGNESRTKQQLPYQHWNRLRLFRFAHSSSGPLRADRAK